MRTPAGTECKYFYGDYYRGRNHEECRLVGPPWTRNLCRTCPVPSILLANACEFMVLKADVVHPLLAALQARVRVTASCEKTHRSGFDAHIGCGECHPMPDLFQEKK